MTITGTESNAPAVNGTYGMEGINKDQNKVIDWAKRKFEECKQERLATQRQWETNLQFYFGEQYLRPDTGFIATPDGPKAIPSKVPYWVARPVINKIRPTLRNEQARLTAQKPTAKIIPASAEDEDHYAALAGEQIWDSIYRDKHIRKTIRKAVFWQTTCGTGFMKDYWDPGAIDRVNNTRGDLVYQAESPFHIYVPDLREEEVEGQPYIFHAQIKTLDFCKMYFPQIPSGSGGLQVEEAMLGNQAGKILGQSESGEKKVLILEIWVKPGAVPMFPNGAMFTIANNKIIQGMEGWPYQHGEYPFSKIDHISTGRFYGESIIKDLIPLQKEYNRTHGQIIENKNRMSKQQLLYVEGSIDPARITSEPGLCIPVQPGAQMPTPLPVQGLPSYVENVLDRTNADWADISGIHEVSKGGVPPGVTAATAISYLQEKDETMLSFSVASIEEAVERVAKHTLNNVQQFWTTKRAVRVTGLDSAFDFKQFIGSELRNNTDINVEAGSAMPMSKSARQASLMEFAAQGLISRDELFENLPMGGIDKLQDRIQIDKRQVQRENIDIMKVTEQQIQQHNMMEMQELMESGFAEIDPDHMMPVDIRTGQLIPPTLIVPVNTYDNHMVHIQEHDNFRKGQKFQLASDAQKRLMDNHVQQHLDALIAKQNGLGIYGQPPGVPMAPEQGAAGQDPMAEFGLEGAEGPTGEAPTEGPAEATTAPTEGGEGAE